MTDKEIIYLAYLKAYSGIKGKKIDRAKYSQKRMEITQRIDRCMMTCKYSVSDIDKRRAVLFGKNIYREYCIFVIANPEGKTDQLKERILELVDKISEIEEQEVFLYKYTLEEGSELNLREILKKGIYIKELTLIGITEVIKHAVENKQITAIIRHQLYNVTLTGKLYHKDGCRYCSGKDVIKIDIASEKGKKYKPCSCIKGKGIQKRILSARKDHKTCLTAFLDESRRDDPIKLIVPGRTDKQNVMSYVICKGYLQGESEIEDKNI
ncbi:MAG: hypothetical protein J5959_16145, partial [Butyrivibrio sp.]|nr:hypothetical protein [Butyrivibrio sp.]